MSYALTLDRVTKRFGDFTAVQGLSLQIPKGSIYGWLGQNGAGKTTTIRMVMSIFYPDEGKISVLGHPNAEAVKDRLGYLPEEKGLYKKMRCGEILAYFGMLKGLTRQVARQRAKDLLGRYGLGDWHDKRIETLSKGMGQKVQVLATLIHEPELVILDEPFSGLDPVNQEALREVILDQKQAGRTVIFSTHVMEHAEKLCDYVFLIHKGIKRLDGPLAQILSAGEHGIQLDYEGDGAVLRTLPGVRRLNDSGKHAELFLAPGHDAQQVLQALAGRLVIRRFDLREPSLHEVFVRTVKEAS